MSGPPEKRKPHLAGRGSREISKSFAAFDDCDDSEKLRLRQANHIRASRLPLALVIASHAYGIGGERHA